MGWSIGGDALGVASRVKMPSSSPSSPAFMPMVFKLDLATPTLNAFDVGPWKRGCLLKDLDRERADWGGNMGVCW